MSGGVFGRVFLVAALVAACLVIVGRSQATTAGLFLCYNLLCFQDY